MPPYDLYIHDTLETVNSRMNQPNRVRERVLGVVKDSDEHGTILIEFA